jgi:hypothetical protein
MEPALMREERAQMVEILHVDTERSGDLYKTANNVEKYESEKLLRVFFNRCCIRYGGVERHWDGDGGYAFFPDEAKHQKGAAVRAAEDFIKGLPSLIKQITTEVGWKHFPLRLRIKAHRGEVFIAPDSGLDTADPRNLDDFLKREEKFAPRTNELFITQQLFSELDQATKANFSLFLRLVNARSLHTALYRRKRIPIANQTHPNRLDGKVSTLRQEDWEYLCEEIEAQILAHTACNQITKGMISLLNGTSPVHKQPAITSGSLMTLVLDALYSYLQLTSGDCQIRLCYWQEVKRHGRRVLSVSRRYPDGGRAERRKRVFPIEDQQWKVCQCFQTKRFIVTSDVASARYDQKWLDFDKGQKSKSRRLDSAMQIPVYCERSDGERSVKAVLSLDVDKPDMFLDANIHLWRERLVGFLVYLALAEELRTQEKL